MKAIKRNFLVVEEKIRLNHINHFGISRYFNPNHFNLGDKLNLHFVYSEGIGAEFIDVKAVYIDSATDMELYEGLEFVEDYKLPFPKDGINKDNEIQLSLLLKEDTKLLWKIAIAISPQIDTLVHLSIS